MSDDEPAPADEAGDSRRDADDGAPPGADPEGVDPAADDEAFREPGPDPTPLPPDAVRPLVHAAVFVGAWTALLVAVGRSPLQSAALGLVGGAVYFVVAYYVL